MSLEFHTEEEPEEILEKQELDRDILCPRYRDSLSGHCKKDCPRYNSCFGNMSQLCFNFEKKKLKELSFI